MLNQGFRKISSVNSVIQRLIVVFALVLAMVSQLVVFAAAKNVYTIQADSDTFTLETSAYTPADMTSRETLTNLLNEAGVDISSTDQIAHNGAEAGDSSASGPVEVEVSVTRAQYATLTIDGALSSALLQEGDTVEAMVERLNIQLGEFDIISLNGEDISSDLSHPLTGGDSVVINRVEISYFEKVKKSSFNTVYQADPGLSIGSEYVKQEGVKGRRIKTYEKKIIDGGEPIITLVDTKYEDAVDKVIVYGTRVYFPGPTALSQSNSYITNRDERNGTITLSDGSTYSYWGKSEFTATAYSSNVGKYTSTGRKAQVGVVAVDPGVIPYGTRMYIHAGGINYGVCVAGDCGVKGKTIDLFFNSTSQCYSFGRRSCTVYFLG